MGYCGAVASGGLFRKLRGTEALADVSLGLCKTIEAHVSFRGRKPTLGGIVWLTFLFTHYVQVQPAVWWSTAITAIFERHVRSLRSLRSPCTPFIRRFLALVLLGLLRFAQMHRKALDPTGLPRHGHLDVLHSLLDASANMDQRDHQGVTPLFTAAEHGNHCIVPRCKSHREMSSCACG